MKLPSNVVQASLWHMLHVAEGMREDEIEQYLALSGADSFDPNDVAASLWLKHGCAFSVLNDKGLPVICGGYYPSTPGLWHSWAIGTYEGWEKHWRAATKATRALIQELFDNGARRLETVCLASREEANHWHTKGLGLQLDDVWHNYGAHGEDVRLYAISRRKDHGHPE